MFLENMDLNYYSLFPFNRKKKFISTICLLNLVGSDISLYNHSKLKSRKNLGARFFKPQNTSKLPPKPIYNAGCMFD